MIDTLKEDRPDDLVVVTAPSYIPANIEPMMEMEKAVELFESIQRFCLGKLKKGKDGDGDYSIIPGTVKPSLLKSGAEKINIWFGLIAEFKNTRDIIDTPDGQIISIDSMCYLKSLQTGRVIAIFGANCNTGENKYRNNYEWIPQWEMPDGVDKKGLETKTIQKRDNKGSFKKYKVEKPLNPWDKYNTVLKMAEKRAFVGATLIATGTSSMFTQDIEDMGNGDYKPQQKKTEPKPKTETGSSGNGVTSQQAKVLEKLVNDLEHIGHFTEVQKKEWLNKIPKLSQKMAGKEITAMQKTLNKE